MPSGEPVVTVEGLTKRYGPEVAVDDLSLSIADGEFKALLGPSGCGKTTTLRCIAGIEHPDEGRITIGDTVVFDAEEGRHVKPNKREIGMVFQSYAIWPHMTVKENVRFPLKMRGIGTKAEREENVRETLELVDLAEYADNLATNLSGGQQQRVAIARSLVVEPEVLLFDEPLSNLDAKLRREMRMEIKEICDSLGITVLYVTHAQDEAMFLADNIALMYDGSTIEENEPEILHTTPKTLFAMDFMGRSNHLSGRVTDRDGSAITVETDIGRFTLEADEVSGDATARDVTLSFRPKFCRIVQNGADAATDGAVVFEGTLKMRAPTRDFTEYHIDVRGTPVLIRDPEPITYREGETVRFAIDRNHVRVFPIDGDDFNPALA